ncbi:MAG TPA: MmgE/PrpD family protein [Streptosporangiaceae bacterium]
MSSDHVQDRLADYADEIEYPKLPAAAVHAAKARFIDTLGALIAGFDGRTCVLARRLASRMPQADGASVLGTPGRTTADLAAFVNTTTSRYAELNDEYHSPGSSHGHPSDTLMGVFAVAEYAHSSGREFITAAALAYEVYIGLADATKLPGFDSANFACIAVAAGAAKLLRLGRAELADAIGLAVVPNNALDQTRAGQLSMWKAAAAGQAGRAGVFAALLAREGMHAPSEPFTGERGWLEYVARNQAFELPPLSGNGESFAVQRTFLKQRSACASSIPAIFAVERIFAEIGDPSLIQHVTVEVNRHAKQRRGGGPARNPQTREAADHSIPYVVAAALRDGTITPRQFDDAHLADQEIRAILSRTDIVENPEFTAAFERVPVSHRARVTVELADGRVVVGESGGGGDDLTPADDIATINAKFTMLVADRIDAELLEFLWQLEQCDDVASIPPRLVLRSAATPSS